MTDTATPRSAGRRVVTSPSAAGAPVVEAGSEHGVEAEELDIWHVYLTGGVHRIDGILTTMTVAADGQARAGHRVTAWLQCEDRLAVSDAMGPRAFGLAVNRSPAATLAAMRERLASAAPDIVHLHSCLRPPHAAVTALLRARGIPYVVAPHSALSPATLSRYRWRKWAYGTAVERRLVRNAAGLACLTRVERDDALRYAGRFDGHAGVVGNPAPAGLFHEPGWSATEADRSTVVTLARWDVYQKGLDILADVARALPDVSFRVYGAQDRNQPQATERLRRSAPDNFALLPPVHGTDKLDVLRGAGMFIQPSRWEGMSASLIEALTLGVPCAISRYVARTLPFTTRGLGLVLDDDPAAAAQELRAALDDDERCAGWSTTSRRFAVERFGPDRVAGRLVDLYRRAIRRANGQADADPRGDGTPTGAADERTR